MKISIEGMHCQACVMRVRKALEKVEGVQVRDVAVGSAEISGDAQAQGEAVKAIEKAGYTPHLAA